MYMKLYKLSESDMKQIANHIAQRSITTVTTGRCDEATDKYLETYNYVLEKLYNYNNTAKDQ